MTRGTAISRDQGHPMIPIDPLFCRGGLVGVMRPVSRRASKVCLYAVCQSRSGRAGELSRARLIAVQSIAHTERDRGRARVSLSRKRKRRPDHDNNVAH